MNRIVEAARTYQSVPFRHRGRSRKGVDCAGLVWCSYMECGIELPDFRKYRREPHRDGLVKHMIFAFGQPAALGPVHRSLLQEGDVVVMRFEIEPHHIGIIGRHPLGHLSIIHANGNEGQYSRVLEQGLSADMLKRITHVFRRPV